MHNTTITQAPSIYAIAPSPETEIYQVTISSAGQITIPVKIRKKLDLHPGDRLVFYPIAGDKIAMVKQRSLHEDMQEWRSSLSAQAKADIKKRAGWTVQQYHDYFDNLPENIAARRKKYGI